MTTYNDFKLNSRGLSFITEGYKWYKIKRWFFRIEFSLGKHRESSESYKVTVYFLGFKVKTSIFTIFKPEKTPTPKDPHLTVEYSAEGQIITPDI